jgi:hypothetical protein
MMKTIPLTPLFAARIEGVDVARGRPHPGVARPLPGH